ncbi:hypothetical protein L226DRAFT_467600 [Lentinus tigrinus ALCF2SS1-7]|uniref:YCII-related domain-containing protein n=1 Tax=Lentinus tigrinus ALCF2SS1-6 TaxID=1328759 RepID=A0A5C2S1F2_9APHY|nr:hypothetical protein L227DRAFT_506959 [Lentinus tigrinus ALCF2SS1-6]RPD71995.1 hypothetical protein L226DRAFT_467600 [Lentinus tigrinus ALCF2SS1-7]
MSSSAPATRHNFIVYAPDMTDAGALQRRLSVRPAHLEKAAEYIQGGMFKVAGAMLSPESIASPTAEKKMVGSVFICEAESLEDVRKFMESDVYYTSGVWDKDKLVILPLALATKTL